MLFCTLRCRPDSVVRLSPNLDSHLRPAAVEESGLDRARTKDLAPTLIPSVPGGADSRSVHSRRYDLAVSRPPVACLPSFMNRDSSCSMLLGSRALSRSQAVASRGLPAADGDAGTGTDGFGRGKGHVSIPGSPAQSRAVSAARKRDSAGARPQTSPAGAGAGAGGLAQGLAGSISYRAAAATEQQQEVQSARSGFGNSAATGRIVPMGNTVCDLT